MNGVIGDAPVRSEVWALARSVAGHRLSPHHRGRWPHEPLDPERWRELCNHVVDERLTGLLAAAVGDGSLPVDSAQRHQLSALERTESALGLRLEARLAELVTHLGELGIDHRVLKGPAMAHLVYAAPELRPFRDIDLLVPGPDIGRVVAELEAAGGTRRFPRVRAEFDARFSKGMRMRLADGLDMDLHRTLALGPYGLALDPDELFADSTPLDVAGTSARALGPEAMLVHAAYHAALGDWPPRLLAHRDVAELLLAGRADPGRVLAMVARWRGEAPLAKAISTAAEWFALDAANPLVAWARQRPFTRREHRTLARYRHGDSSALAASGTAYVKGLRNRAAYVRLLLMPADDYLGSREGSRAARWRHAIRVVRRLAPGRRR